MKKPDLFVYKSGLLTALLLLGTPVAQADMVDAAMYVATEQYDKAFAEYTREATNGNSEAFYWLGMMYYNGTGTTQDYNKAIDWFLRAAAEHGENGDDKAMKMLGDMNLLGQGIDKNPVSALEYYKHAADLGNADAGYITGNIYAQGLDTIKPNLTYSLIYWEQAAEAGNIPSMQNAAYLYETGLAGTKDH
ncbi:MAG TPA: tetratricopeptide repeat protein, partial [Emcibacteraceae bacterium]|nr:tetratricopeptide repeat protein [Emcibacteraceae bacterium]